MTNEASAAPKWARSVDHPVIVRTSRDTDGRMSFEAASPHLFVENKDAFKDALLPGVSLCTIEPAKQVFRNIPKDEKTIPPESCTPYTDANGLGFYLKNVLPLVFVRTRSGEVLPEARVAIKYMRENEGDFRQILEKLKLNSHRVFREGRKINITPEHEHLFSDVAQPYASFTNLHMAMKTGCYVMTPPGLTTFMGPPVNQQSPLRMYSGLVETDWYHSELFLVFDSPAFSGQFMCIEPGTVLAQLYFVAKCGEADSTEIRFNANEYGADPSYRERSIEAGVHQIERGQEVIESRLTGVKSISASCPHCWVSVTAAADHGVPDSHVEVDDFLHTYRALRREYRSFMVSNERDSLKIKGVPRPRDDELTGDS